MELPRTKELTRRVKDFARDLGFDAAGVCDLAPIDRGALRRWLERGFAGEMFYMHRQAAKRAQPATIAPGSSRALVVLKNYFPASAVEPRPRGKIARYAWGEDYHLVLGEKLALLAAFLVRLGASLQRTRWFVDAGPAPERELAQRAGLGWMGKSTMLISPRLGSFTFIGSVFTDLNLDPDAPFSADRCGSCRRCLEACPTGALVEERVLDARRCISYLTIEHRGEFPAGTGELIGEWVFGCDVCQEVCPWNQKLAAPTDEERFFRAGGPPSFSLEEAQSMDERAFGLRFGQTALKRVGAWGWRRNARQVRENLAHPWKVKGCGAGSGEEPGRKVPAQRRLAWAGPSRPAGGQERGAGPGGALDL